MVILLFFTVKISISEIISEPIELSIDASELAHDTEEALRSKVASKQSPLIILDSEEFVIEGRGFGIQIALEATGSDVWLGIGFLFASTGTMVYGGCT
jgi:hypothetical protein